MTDSEIKAQINHIIQETGKIPTLFIDDSSTPKRTYIIEICDEVTDSVVRHLFDRVYSYLAMLADRSGWPENEAELYTACIYYKGDVPIDIPLTYDFGCRKERIVLITA